MIIFYVERQNANRNLKISKTNKRKRKKING